MIAAVADFFYNVPEIRAGLQYLDHAVVNEREKFTAADLPDLHPPAVHENEVILLRVVYRVGVVDGTSIAMIIVVVIVVVVVVIVVVQGKGNYGRAFSTAPAAATTIAASTR